MQALARWSSGRPDASVVLASSLGIGLNLPWQHSGKRFQALVLWFMETVGISPLSLASLLDSFIHLLSCLFAKIFFVTIPRTYSMFCIDGVASIIFFTLWRC